MVSSYERYQSLTSNTHYQLFISRKVIHTDHKKLICTYCYPDRDWGIEGTGKISLEVTGLDLALRVDRGDI